MSENAKNEIRSYIKNNNKIISNNKFYELILNESIGEGGNALVWGASLGKLEVAVKFLTENCSDDKYSNKDKRFVDEFLGLLPLVKTGVIVPLYYFDYLEINQNKYLYIVMERQSCTLKIWVKNHPIKNLDQITKFINRFIKCLEILHKNKIIHRDLKPENIFISHDNNLIIGDFGISWFDTERYEKLAQTTKGERLANFAFSAPEQFMKDPEPAFTMDLFSMGEIIQWMVTGSPHIRGTGRKQLSDNSIDFKPIDTFVEKLLNNDPSNRPQTIEDAKYLLNQLLSPPEDIWLSLAEKKVWQVNKFNDLLAKGIPGSNGYTQAQNIIVIDRVLESINEMNTRTRIGDLYWTQGPANNHAYPFNKITDGEWIINGIECKIVDLWTYRNPTYERQYVIIHTAPKPQFEIYEETDYYYEEAGFFKGHYIKRNEYDDGYAIIDNQVVELDESVELRKRFFRDEFLILTPQSSVYIAVPNSQNDKIIDGVYQNLLYEGKISQKILTPLESLPRASWMSMLD